MRLANRLILLIENCADDRAASDERENNVFRIEPGSNGDGGGVVSGLLESLRWKAHFVRAQAVLAWLQLREGKAAVFTGSIGNGRRLRLLGVRDADNCLLEWEIAALVDDCAADCEAVGLLCGGLLHGSLAPRE